MNKLTVLVSDDHPVFRQGLRGLLDAAGDIRVVGEAENGQRAVAEAIRLKPELVLMDISMPILNGVEAARQIVREMPAIKVLILSASGDDLRVHQAIHAGVAGYLTKETAGKDILHAIREACKGNAYFSPPIARRLLSRCNGGVGTPGFPQLENLTHRQTEIVQLIAEGHSTKQIAGLLSVTRKTVETHRQRVMDKLDIRGIVPLTRHAAPTGIVESNYTPDWPRSTNGRRAIE